MPSTVLAPVHTRLLRSRRFLDNNAVASGVLNGPAAETTMRIITIPGGITGPNGQIRCESMWVLSGSGNKTIRVRCGGTQWFGLTLTTVTLVRTLTIIEMRNSLNAQLGFYAGTANTYSQQTSPVVTATIDFTSDKDLILTGEIPGAGDTIKVESHFVEIIYGA